MSNAVKDLCKQANIVLSLKGGISKRPVQSIWIKPQSKENKS